MNKKAIELGCNDTHFVNPSGLHDENHYSCAHDLAIMYKYAYDNFELFRDLVSSTSCSLPITDKYLKEDRIFTNPNKLIIKSVSNEYYYEYCTGGKTGYTSEAKNCLVSSASKNGINLICCVLGGTQSDTSESYRYKDSIALFDYGFELLRKTDIITAGTIVKKTTIANAKSENNELCAVADQTLSLALSNSNVASDFSPEIIIFDELTAPISKGEKIGFLKYEIYGSTYMIDLVADKDIEEKPKLTIGAIIKAIFINLLKIFVVLLLLVGIIFAIRFMAKKGGKRQRLQIMRKYNSRFHR